MKDTIELKLFKLSKSKFRSSFHLNNKMVEYSLTKGIEKIKSDAYDLINKRLKPSIIPNDGKQTPMKQVHPVFIAQHACGCCCRGCLEKWYNIPKGRELTEEEINYIVSILIRWIELECRRKNENFKK